MMAQLVNEGIDHLENADVAACRGFPAFAPAQPWLAFSLPEILDSLVPCHSLNCQSCGTHR
jgi:hypothetical protein